MIDGSSVTLTIINDFLMSVIVQRWRANTFLKGRVIFV